MGIHTNAMELLKVIYNHCNTHHAYEIGRETYMSLSSEDRLDLDNRIKYLHSGGFIENFAPCVGVPISVEISPAGIRTVEGISIAPSSTTNIVYGNNYGITGNNASGNTISIGLSFEDMKALIAATVPNEADRSTLVEALQPLYDRIEIGAPIEKGLLSKVSDKLQEYQELLSAVASSILPYLLGK